jgi:hypothetical protein
MKNKILSLLIKYKIIKNGYVNPTILFSFIILIPFVLLTIRRNEILEREAIETEECLSEILAHYESEYKEEFEGIAPIEPVEASIIPVGKKKQKNNLQLLLERVANGDKKLSKWDLFRLKVYQASCSIKEKYPEMGATPDQIYDWSMKTFYRESRYLADAKNPHSSAYGIFQAMSTTRKELNMPKNISAIQQVKYYEDYICKQINQQKLDVSNIRDAVDWYMITFYPALADKPDKKVFAKCVSTNKWICSKKGGWKRCNYHANQAYDVNKDCVIYKEEIGNHLLNK